MGAVNAQGCIIFIEDGREGYKESIVSLHLHCVTGDFYALHGPPTIIDKLQFQQGVLRNRQGGVQQNISKSYRFLTQLLLINLTYCNFNEILVLHDNNR